MQSHAITRNDLHLLIREPSPNVREMIAKKVSEGYKRSRFTSRENTIAIEILRLLVRDTATSVRKSVADQLKDCKYVPKDVMLTLSADIADVASQVLEHSLVFTDEDLAYVIESSKDVKKWLAISRRQKISAFISGLLIGTHHQDVIRSLLGNAGAEIKQSDLTSIAEEFRQDQNILEALVSRGGLTPEFAERLYSMVSDKFMRQLTKRNIIPRRIVNEAVKVTRESAIIRFIAPWMTLEDIIKLVDQMERNKRLSYSMMLRALCMGEVMFFEVALAKKIGIPVANAHKLLTHPSDKAFHTLYQASSMPATLAEAIRVFMNIAREETNGGKMRIDNFQQRMIERIEAEGYDKKIENMQYLVTLLRSVENESQPKR
ncbi:MAG: DUF2336 domain-containing protein [Rickettsiales bacterium]